MCTRTTGPQRDARWGGEGGEREQSLLPQSEKNGPGPGSVRAQTRLNAFWRECEDTWRPGRPASASPQQSRLAPQSPRRHCAAVLQAHACGSGTASVSEVSAPRVGISGAFLPPPSPPSPPVPSSQPCPPCAADGVGGMRSPPTLPAGPRRRRPDRRQRGRPPPRRSRPPTPPPGAEGAAVAARPPHLPPTTRSGRVATLCARGGGRIWFLPRPTPGGLYRTGGRGGR